MDRLFPLSIFDSIRRKYKFLLIGLGTSIFFMYVAPPLFSSETVVTNALTAEEKDWLEKNPDKLVLWFDPDSPPIEFTSETGEFMGLGADIITLVEKKLGISFIKYASNDWQAKMTAMKDGVCAVLPALIQTPEREDYVQFTTSYAVTPVVIITGTRERENLQLKDLHGKRVAVLSGSATKGYLQEYSNVLFEVIPMPDEIHALEATSFGQVDAFVENLATAVYHIEKEGIPNLRIAGIINSPSLRIGISKKYPLLASAVKKTLSSIPENDIEIVRKRWISLKLDARWSPETIRLLVTIIIFVVLLLLGLVVISIVLKRRLREKVAGLEAASLKISEQTEFLQLATEVTQAGLWDYRPEEDVFFYSKQWFSMLGYDREGEKMSSDSIKEFIHPDDYPFVKQSYHNYTVSNDNMFSEIELRLRKSDGSWCWILSKGKVVAWDEKGAVTPNHRTGCQHTVD